MPARIKKVLCLVLLCAALAGIFSGCDFQRLWTMETTAATIVTTPSSAVTALATVPSTAVTEPTQQPAEPPVPLPPSTAHTLQTPTWQKPAVTIPQLTATNFFIYDTGISEFLYISCDESQAIYPASTTKLFTTYVALQYLAPEDIVTVGSELSYVVYDASTVGFCKGDRVSVEALAYSALLPSGCDASYILAAAAGRVILSDKNAAAKNAISAFMDECNRMAKELGMENTNFVTPDGYHHEDHKLSMGAFVIIGKCSLENKLIAKVVASAETTIAYTNSQGKACTLLLRNTNQAIRPDSEHFDTACVGLKTGFTDDAGYCLLTAYEVDCRYILVGIFGSRTSSDRFKDAGKLFHAYLPYL